MGSGWFFLEIPEFSRVREHYFRTDASFALAQNVLSKHPDAGEVMPGCGGVRKLRLSDPRRAKGRRGGLRLLYLQIPEIRGILLLDVYDKDEKDDLTTAEKKAIHRLAGEFKKELVAVFGRRKRR